MGKQPNPVAKKLRQTQHQLTIANRKLERIRQRKLERKIAYENSRLFNQLVSSLIWLMGPPKN